MLEVQHIMGMPVEVDLRDRGIDAAIAFDWLREVDATFSTYSGQSEISRLGRGELDAASPTVEEVLASCEQLRLRTRGYFDVRATGRLDPSGFVKGWALAGAAARLRAAGAREFLINAGGDVVVAGGPWRVGIRHPLEHDHVAAVLPVQDAAVATSGEYERGRHVIDPHSGRPPEGLLSVTIVGRDLAEADAFATAAFAMGAGGPRWAAALEGYEALCITAEREVLSTPGLVLDA